MRGLSDEVSLRVAQQEQTEGDDLRVSPREWTDAGALIEEHGMAENPYINESVTDSTGVQPVVTLVVRAAPGTTEEELRAQAEDHLLEGHHLGKLVKQYPEGEEIVFEFEAIGS